MAVVPTRGRQRCRSRPPTSPTRSPGDSEPTIRSGKPCPGDSGSSPTCVTSHRRSRSRTGKPAGIAGSRSRQDGPVPVASMMWSRNTRPRLLQIPGTRAVEDGVEVLRARLVRRPGLLCEVCPPESSLSNQHRGHTKSSQGAIRGVAGHGSMQDPERAQKGARPT